MAKKEKKGYEGPKLVNDNPENRKKRAQINSQSEKRLSNDEFTIDNLDFQKACAIAEIPPTPRQASKWRQPNPYGKAARAAGRNSRKDPVKI